MLTANPRSTLAWSFELLHAGRAVGQLQLRHLREGANITLEGREYSVERESRFGPWVLCGPGGELARAEKPGLFQRRFSMQHAGRTYELALASVFGRRVELSRGGRRIGTLEAERWFSRRMRIDLGNDLPLPVQAFIACLTLFLWRRAQAAAAM